MKIIKRYCDGDSIRYYTFRLSNGEDRNLKTEKSLEEIKQEIIDNKWIKLYSCGHKYVGDWMVYVPKESDVQTCNIIDVVEDVDYQKDIDKQNEDIKNRLNIIKEIETYKFNFKMKIWFKLNTYMVYIDKDYEHPWLSFNEKFLQIILSKCKQYNCKLILED